MLNKFSVRQQKIEIMQSNNRFVEKIPKLLGSIWFMFLNNYF